MEHVPDRATDAAAFVEAEREGDRLEALLEGIEPLPPAPEVRQTYGTVDAVEADTLLVRVSGRPIRARRAISCLVEPVVGDRVLVALACAWQSSTGGPADESFILAVLVKGERRASGVTLAADGDVTLRSRGGKLTLVADEAVSLASGSKIELNSPELEVRAMKTSFFSASLAYIGRALDGEIDRITLVAQTVDRAIDRVSERIKCSFRTIEEIEKVKAKELDVDVEGNVTLHSDNTIMSAEKLVKVDGEQIHLG
jgi:hypothetical protein